MRTEQPGLYGSAAFEVRALAALGKTAELTRLIEGSTAGPTGAGTTPADLLLLASDELRAHGHPSDAARLLDEAIARYRSAPAQARSAQRAALARALYRAERWREAGALLEELASEQPHNVHITGQLAALAARTGDLPRARALAAAIGEPATPRARATHTLWRARIAASMGERERALELLGTAFAEGAARGLWLHTDPHFAGLDADPRFRAWLRVDG